MRILITGATGFIGKNLVSHLNQLGHKIVVVSRNIDYAKSVLGKDYDYLQWDPTHKSPSLNKVKPIDAVINLAGESIAAKRWNKEQKDLIYSSRVDYTRKLFQSLKKYKIRPKLFINASAIGIYGTSVEDHFDEQSKAGDGFLPMVVHDWESVVRKHESVVSRWAILRIGMVLGKGGGAIEKLLPMYKLGLGSTLGSGAQQISWIHIKDLIKMFSKIIEDESLSGVFNATSEFSVTNSEFSNVLSKLLQKPSFVKVPTFALKTMLGERSMILLEGARVFPQRFKELKFHYQYPTVEKALKDVVSEAQRH